jgi:hypothetical protein
VSKRKRQSLGQAMGQAIVGFDYQVFRATKPPPELVEEGKPIAPVAAADGGLISIDLPPAGRREGHAAIDGTDDTPEGPA